MRATLAMNADWRNNPQRWYNYEHAQEKNKGSSWQATGY